MSSYKNLTKVFPKRCHDLLKLYPFARWADREVTLLLSVASSGLTIPLERLEQKNYPYPFADSVTYQRAHDNLMDLLADKFCSSVLLEKSPRRWCFGRLATTDGDPDDWDELRNPEPMPNKKPVKEVLRHLRNALAHGCVHTKGDPITEIIFIASVKPHSPNFNYLIVSPDDFRTFLRKWFNFLSNLKFD